MALTHVFNDVENRNTGVPMSGVTVKAFDMASDTLLAIYADDSLTPFVPANTCTSDADGMYGFYIDATAVYRLRFYDGATLIKSIDNAQNVGPAGPSGPANSTYATTTALEGADVTNLSAILSEAGKAGTFTIREFSDFSAEVAADTGKVSYIRSTATPSKVWVRTSILSDGAAKLGSASGLGVQTDIDARPTAATLALPAGAASIGSTGPSNVQADINARPTSASLVAVGGAALIGTSSGETVQEVLDGLADDITDLSGGLTELSTDFNLLRENEVNPESWGFGSGLRWNLDPIGSIPKAVRLVGAATAVINSDGLLEVDALQSGSTKCYLNLKFSAGILLFQVKRGPFQLHIVYAGRSKVLRSDDGNNFLFDNYNGVASTTPTFIYQTPSGGGGTSIANLPGAIGDLMWVELGTALEAQSTNYTVRIWKDGDPRPSIPNYAATYPAFPANNQINDGYIRLASYSGSTAKFGPILTIDGRTGVPADRCAAFVGRCPPGLESGALCRKLMAGGSKMRFVVTGANGVVIRYAGVYGVLAPSSPPVADLYVNGVHNRTVTFAGVDGTLGLKALNAATFLDDLDPDKSYWVEMRMRGIDSANDKWNYGYGLAVESLVPVDGAGSTRQGVVAPWPDARPAMLFLGDSTTEGVRARGLGGSIDCGGDLSWPVLFSESQSLRCVPWAFGGTGLATAGAGNMVPIPSNTFSYLNTYPVDPDSERIRYIALMAGINDFANGVSGATFQAALTTLLRNLLIQYPDVVRLFVIRDLFGHYQTEIVAAIAAVGDGRIVFVNTNGWVVDTTDGTHFSLLGHQQFFTQFQTAVAADMNTGVIP